MRAIEQLLACSEYLNASEYYELTIAIKQYMAGEQVDIASSGRLVRLAFQLVSASIDEEEIQEKRQANVFSEAGKKGAAKRWGKKDETDSPQWPLIAPIKAIGGYCRPFSEIEEKEASPSVPPIPPSNSLEEKEEIKETPYGGKEKKNLAQRRKEFGESLKEYIGEPPDKYPREMLLKFYTYWSESNPGGRKMRFEMQPTWDLAGRIRTWASKDCNQPKTNGKRKHSSDSFASAEELAGRTYVTTIQLDDEGG